METDGGERRGVAWRGVREESNEGCMALMQPLCHGNAVKFISCVISLDVVAMMQEGGTRVVCTA